MKKIGDKYVGRIDLAVGDTRVMALATSGPATIAVAPEAGGTVTVEFTCSAPGQDGDYAGSLWVPAEGLGAGGVVAALTLDIIPGTITALRVAAAAAGARVEVAQ